MSKEVRTVRGGVGVRRRGEGESEGRRGGLGELGKMERLRWRKSGYGSKEEDILINGAIFGLAGVQRDVPS